MDYAGDISPEDCWEMLAKGGAIVDVRTTAEWTYVGIPVPPEGAAALLMQQWQVFPQMEVDPNFTEALEAQLAEKGVAADAPLCFLCRSGVRSLAAARAMTVRGRADCYNIAGGFEGDLDENAHRGHRNGWKVAGLPWAQR